MIKAIYVLLLLVSLQGYTQLTVIKVVPDTGMTMTDLGIPPSEMQQLNDPDLQYVAPFQVFDNLYYIGTKWVSAYVIKTSEGLILIDALFGNHTVTGIENIKKLGLYPETIKYVIVTHGHFDHAGGAETFQRLFGAHIIMSGADWERVLVDQSDPSAPFKAPLPDLLAKDGDTLRLGDTKITFYETPGHTEGVLSLDFMVRDGPSAYRAFVFGGVGLNFSGVERTKMYIHSVERIMALANTPVPIAVNISNHPAVNDILALSDAIGNHNEGHHPMVSPEAFKNWLLALKEAALVKLREEEKSSLKGK